MPSQRLVGKRWVHVAKRSTRNAVLACAIAASIVTTGCSRLSDSHGYVPEPSALDDVVVGRDTRETVALSVGRPGTAGILADSAWYYVRSDYERFLWRAPVEVDREVVAISFAENGTVSNIERFGLEDGQVVALNRRVTDSNTQGIGFLRQLFSNFGNFNPGALLSEGN